jgi:hypothetical protein
MLHNKNAKSKALQLLKIEDLDCRLREQIEDFRLLIAD